MKKKIISILMIVILLSVAVCSILYFVSMKEKKAELELTKLLESSKQEANILNSRVVKISVDGTMLTYSMNDLGELTYYKCSDKSFRLGEEDALKSYYLNLKKDVSANSSISVCCTHDEKKLDKTVNAINKRFSKKAIDSRINRHGTITYPKDGRSIDTKQIKNDILIYLNQRTPSPFSKDYSTVVVKPKWYPKDLKKVNTVIAKYQTSFVQNTNRGYNISLATKRLNDICLLPGEKISFLDVLYDNHDHKKYKTSNGILKGRIVPAVGGGICQVSTTAYTAFLFAGIKAIERYPHQTPVGYSHPGLDAALSVGGKNLVIENTLDMPLLIKSSSKGGVIKIRLVSSKNALKGYSYVPRTYYRTRYKATSYIDVFKKKKKVKSIYLGVSKYNHLK